MFNQETRIICMFLLVFPATRVGVPLHAQAIGRTSYSTPAAASGGTVPSVVGEPVARASSTLSARGYLVQVTLVDPPDRPGRVAGSMQTIGPGCVIRQDPVAGARAGRGRTVRLDVIRPPPGSPRPGASTAGSQLLPGAAALGAATRSLTQAEAAAATAAAARDRSLSPEVQREIQRLEAQRTELMNRLIRSNPGTPHTAASRSPELQAIERRLQELRSPHSVLQGLNRNILDATSRSR